MGDIKNPDFTVTPVALDARPDCHFSSLIAAEICDLAGRIIL